MFYLSILLAFVFFASLAMTIAEGLWSNAIGFLAVVFAGVLAAAVGFPLGFWALEKFEKDQSFTWYFVFAATWLAFFVSVLVFRIVSERLSTVRMRFLHPVELAGGPLMSLLMSIMFTSFVAYTLLLPMAAKEWDLKKAASWQQSAFTVGSAPFMSVFYGVTGERLQDRVGLK